MGRYYNNSYDDSDHYDDSDNDYDDDNYDDPYDQNDDDDNSYNNYDSDDENNGNYHSYQHRNSNNAFKPRRQYSIQKQKTSSKIFCYSCGKPGHLRPDCPTAPTCYNCQKKGHFSSVCLSKKDTCFACGKEGHYRSDCPNVKKEKLYLEIQNRIRAINHPPRSQPSSLERNEQSEKINESKKLSATSKTIQVISNHSSNSNSQLNFQECNQGFLAKLSNYEDQDYCNQVKCNQEKTSLQIQQIEPIEEEAPLNLISQKLALDSHLLEAMKNYKQYDISNADNFSIETYNKEEIDPKSEKSQQFDSDTSKNENQTPNFEQFNQNKEDLERHDLQKQTFTQLNSYEQTNLKENKNLLKDNLFPKNSFFQSFQENKQIPFKTFPSAEGIKQKEKKDICDKLKSRDSFFDSFQISNQVPFKTFSTIEQNTSSNKNLYENSKTDKSLFDQFQTNNLMNFKSFSSIEQTKQNEKKDLKEKLQSEKSSFSSDNSIFPISQLNSLEQSNVSKSDKSFFEYNKKKEENIPVTFLGLNNTNSSLSINKADKNQSQTQILDNSSSLRNNFSAFNLDESQRSLDLNISNYQMEIQSKDFDFNQSQSQSLSQSGALFNSIHNTEISSQIWKNFFK